LPAPWHLLVGHFNFNELTWPDRWAVAKLSARLQVGDSPLSSDTVETWLKRWGQTSNLIRAVWEPLCIAALNEPITTASARLFATVIKRALLGSADDSKIIISKVGLSRLFAPEAERLLNFCGSKILRNKVATKFEFDGNRITGVATQDGSVFPADHVISALPWNALRALLPSDSPLAIACRQIGDAPIVSVQLWLDKNIMDRPFIGFLDSPLHWIFSSSHIHTQNDSVPDGAEAATPSYHYALIISGARALIDQSSEEIEAMVLRELNKFLPESRDAHIIHRLIYKSRSATFAATPETEKLRPNAATTSPNFWLAGDWTNTSLPATLEGAIVSGQTAARLVDAA
jgi:squalene-associated FAD-dependent desaturase